MLPTPDALVLGNTNLGAASEVTLSANKPVTIKEATGYVPSGTERASCISTTATATSTTALGGGRGCALLSPNCYLQVPHHWVSGQRAGGGIGSVSQLSLNRERGSGCESTAKGSGHAEGSLVGLKSACKVRGAGENGGMSRGLGCMPDDRCFRRGRCGSTVESLAYCNPATDHQMVVDVKTGGSSFAASGAVRRLRGAPWSPNEEHRWQGAGIRTADGLQSSHLSCDRAGYSPDLPGVSWAQGQVAAACRGEPGSQEH
jgi:hypothetical protein